MKIAKRYKNVSLNNGAVLRYSQNKLNKITSIEILFNGGAHKDTIPGLAHFVEHMFFTGTKTLSKQEVSKKYFDFIGTNAHTTSKKQAACAPKRSHALLCFLFICLSLSFCRTYFSTRSGSR